MELQAFLSQKNLLSPEECAVIDASFQGEVVPKGETIHTTSRFSKKLLFIESGLLRVFYIKDGKDITHFFFDENHFVVMIMSIFHSKSERYEFEATEACRIKVIQYEDFLKLNQQFPNLSHIIFEFTAQILDAFSHKLNVLQSEKAKERYNIFLERYPNLINRVSLGDTASFLGITQQTLSVIRAQKK